MPLYSVTIFWEVSLYPGYMNTSVFCIHILGSIIVSWIHEHLCILYPYFRKYHCILDTWTPLYSVSIFYEVSLYHGCMNTSVFCIHILGSITVSWIHEYPCIQHYGIKLCTFLQVKRGKGVNYIWGGGLMKDILYTEDQKTME